MTQGALDRPDVRQSAPVEPVRESLGGRRLGGLARRMQALKAAPHLVTWTGIALCTVGVVLLVVAWGRTAGLANVALQIPYLISAGFTGMALVVVGLTVVNIEAKRIDAAERSRQLNELRSLLAELRTMVEEDNR